MPPLIIFAVAFGVYADSLANQFVHDDMGQVVLNSFIRDFRFLPRLFATSIASFPAKGQVMIKNNYYRPVMYLVYMIAYAVFGLRPWGFHLINVLLHGAASVAVYFAARAIIKNLRGPVSNGDSWFSRAGAPFFSALIFAAHPIHTEDVAWVAAVPDIVYSLLLLLAFVVWAKYESIKGALLSAALFFAACFTKETALVLPLIFFLYDLCAKRLVKGPAGFFKDLLKRYAPLAAAIIVYLIMRLNALHGMAPQEHLKNLGGAALAANGLWLFSQYLYKLALPLDLNAHHEFHPIKATDPRAFIALIAAVFFIICCYAAFRKKPVIFMGLVFIAAPILPVLYAPVLGANVFAERYLYLPVFGFSLIVSNAFAYLRERWKPSLVTALAAVLIASYSYAAAVRNTVWKTSLSLWADTVNKSPEAALPNLNLGWEYLKEGKPGTALPYLEVGIKGVPDYAIGHSLAGQALSALGRNDEALKEFLEAVRLDPGRYEAYGDVGALYAEKGDFQDAIIYLDKSRELNPNSAGVYFNLGELYLKTGRKDKAVENFRKAVSLDPGNPQYIAVLKSVQ